MMAAHAGMAMAPGRTYFRILGVGNLRALWHALVGIATSGGNVTGWVDWFGSVFGSGVSVIPTGVSNRPPYGADSTFFGGKSVVQCAATGQKTLHNFSV